MDAGRGSLLQYLGKYPRANLVAIVRVHGFLAGECTEICTPDDWSCRWTFLSPFQRRRSRRLEGGQSHRLERFCLLTVVHRLNILFDTMGVPRISDLGVSSVTSNPVSNNASTPFRACSIRWAAPEILAAPNDESLRPTKISDVYAFGMVVIEVRYHHYLRRRGSGHLR